MFAVICMILIARYSYAAPVENVKGNDSRPLCPCHNNSSLNTRVVGGHEVGRNTFPFASGLLYQSPSWYRALEEKDVIHPFCGGTLITDRHVITAAHCIRGKTKEMINVDIGDYSLKDKEDGTIVRSRRVTKHPDYVSKTFYSDIGVIELQKAVSFDSGLRTSWLPEEGLELDPGTTVQVFGWGRLNYSGDSPDKLQSVDLPVMEHEKCKSIFMTKIEHNMLCAGGEVGKDACIGDSGSGLVVRMDKELVLVGVVSFGKRCALPKVPGVYTKVSSFTKWVLEQTENAGCRPCVYGTEN